MKPILYGAALITFLVYAFRTHRQDQKLRDAETPDDDLWGEGEAAARYAFMYFILVAILLTSLFLLSLFEELM